MAAQNVKMAVRGNTLTITVDLSKKLGRSKGGSGPNEMIATTGGNVDVTGKPEIKLGLNVYTKAD
jgi:hypothetical protein